MDGGLEDDPASFWEGSFSGAKCSFQGGYVLSYFNSRLSSFSTIPLNEKFDPPGHHLASMAPRINGTSVSKTKICTWPFGGNVRKHIPIFFKYLVVRLNHPIANSSSLVKYIGNLPKFPSIGLKCLFSLGDVGCFLVGVHRVQPPNHKKKSHGWGSIWGHDEQNLGFSWMEVYVLLSLENKPLHFQNKWSKRLRK